MRFRLDLNRVNSYNKSLPSYSGCKGSVVRLQVTDFMTYHFAELHAGANVNLILGPNGTGKSTIVCAICLGLAGKPKILGRALALREYIRHGAKAATIEIELYNPNGLNYVIRRHIKESSTGTSTLWYLGSEKVGSSVIEKLTASLNIQLDNLCQFLPQDRVSEFVVMDSSSLLQNTQKALGSLSLYERHQNLIKLTSTHQDIEKNVKAHSNSLKTEQQYTKRLEKDVENYRDREALKTKLAEMTSKKAWLQYIKARDAFSELKTQLEAVTHTKKLEEAKLAPTKKAVDQLETRKGKLWLDLNRMRNKSTTLVNGVKRKAEEEFDKIEAKLSEEQAKLAQHEEAEAHRLKRIANVNIKIQTIEKQLEEIRMKGDMDDTKFNKDLRVLEQKLGALDNEIAIIGGMDDKDNDQRRYLQVRKRTTEMELSRMDDLRISRMKYLEREQRDAYELVRYLEKPESRQHFKGKIHEPMVLHISVNDLKYGKVLERHIGFTELNGFFCEHKDDVVNLLNLTEKMGKRVAVTQYELDYEYERPESVYDEEFMRKWKFEKVLMDLVEGPDYYLSYLSNRFQLEKILIGSKDTEKMFEEIRDGTSLNLFYTENSTYAIKKSNYASSKVLSCGGLAPARVMTHEINAMEKQRLVDLLEEIKREDKILEAQVKSRAGKKMELEEERQNVEDKIKDINARMEYRKNLQQRRELARKQLIQFEKDKRDLESLKKAYKIAVREHRLKLVSFMPWVSQEICKTGQDGFMLNIHRRQVSLMESYGIQLGNKYEQMQGEVKLCESRIKALSPEVDAAAREADASKKDAIAKSNNVTECPADVSKGEITESFVDKELNQANVQLRFLMETDPGIVRDYQEKMRKIVDLQKRKESEEKRLARLEKEIEKEKEDWFNPLAELVDTVNNNFGRYFSNMGCAGEVVLHKAPDENDFAKYGIKILVKFRSTDPLSELGGNKGLTLQSGGERVISTALYILALQELTTVPFRVIDEINQGMDELNESRFFNLLCKLAQGPNTPQYFLLTPKMLPSFVAYPDNLCLHFIMSGPHVNVPIEGHPYAVDDVSGEED